MSSRIDYLDSYSPSEASQYLYGNVVPNPVYTLKKRIALLNKMKDDSANEPQSDMYQRFLVLQNNPEALFQAEVNLPNTPFGNLSSFAQ